MARFSKCPPSDRCNRRLFEQLFTHRRRELLLLVFGLGERVPEFRFQWIALRLAEHLLEKAEAGQPGPESGDWRWWGTQSPSRRLKAHIRNDTAGPRSIERVPIWELKAAAAAVSAEDRRS